MYTHIYIYFIELWALLTKSCMIKSDWMEMEKYSQL